MSETVLHFERGGRRVAVTVRVAPDRIAADWQRLRVAMTRNIHPAFTRDEWAYLIQFVGAARLLEVWREAFGERTDEGPADALAVARGRVALWLPNNVSLLGCLTLALLSLTGATVRVKAGSRSRDLCTAFVDYARQHTPEGPLRDWLRDGVVVAAFGRADTANREMAIDAEARIFFGSDEGAAGVAMLPAPPGSPFHAFGHKVSEAWLTAAQARDPACGAVLAKVFAIFGQAGCTSPKRAVVIGGDAGDARALGEAIAAAWPSADAPVAQASEVVLGAQWAQADGLHPHRLPRNTALLVASPARPAHVYAHLALQLQWGTLDETLSTCAPQLQTVGHGGTRPPEAWTDAIARTAATRLVPLARMHDFGPTWDGLRWWEGMFRHVAL